MVCSAIRRLECAQRSRLQNDRAIPVMLLLFFDTTPIRYPAYPLCVCKHTSTVARVQLPLRIQAQQVSSHSAYATPPLHGRYTCATTRQAFHEKSLIYGIWGLYFDTPMLVSVIHSGTSAHAAPSLTSSSKSGHPDGRSSRR